MVNEHEQPVKQSTTGRVVEIWSLLLRHVFLILFMGGVGTALGYLYYVKTPPIYQSSGSMLIRNESNNKTIPFQGVETSSAGQRDQPHALLIGSPVVIKDAFDKPLGQGYPEGMVLGDLPCFSNKATRIGYISNRLTAKPSIQNNTESHDIVNVSFRDSDPMLCKSVLDAVLSSYEDFLGASHSKVSNDVLELIKQAHSTLTTQLKEIEEEYIQFRQETPLLFSADSKAKNIHKDRMSEIEAARGRLMIVLTERRAELQSINESLARGASREAVTLMLQATKKDESRAAEFGIKSPNNEIFQLMLEEQLLLIDLGPDHPKVKALQKKIALTQDFYLSEMSEDEKPKRTKRGDFLKICIDAIRQEIHSLETRQLELDELFDSERHASRSISVFEVKNETFQKEIQRMESLYQGVVNRLEELKLIDDYGGYKANVISPPAIGRYVAPVRDQCLLIGAVLGCAMGIALSYLAESNDRSFRSPTEVSECLGLPIVGQIPVIRREKAIVRKTSAMDETLVTFFKPKSRLAECYRAIRTSLYFSTRGEKHKAIQVTSPNPGDGKSTLSCNLSISIAQSGKKVLLIDADFRRPRVHEIFGLDNSVGITSIIGGDVELPDAIQSTEVDNLWVLSCGPIPDNPCELLTSARFEELLEVFKDQYDFVIIDTPPVLAVTDPCAVAARVDGVLLTLRLATRVRGDALKATDQLASVGANTLGVIVNSVAESGGYGYGYGYGYRYSYGYSSYYQRGPNAYINNSDEEGHYYQNAPEQGDQQLALPKQRARSRNQDA